MGENVLSEELRRAAIPQQPATEEVIVSNQPQQPPTGEQMMNEAARAGMVQQDAQYRAAQQEALAQQALQQNMAALANLFTDYSRPSDDIYNDTYNKLVMSGIYGDEAHRLASRKASEYSANRLARLQMGMQNDGVTPDGYLTNNGMYYLTQMQGEDPAVASLYAQGYANMPKVAYDRQWDIAKGDHNAERSYQYGKQSADDAFGRSVDMLNIKQQMERQSLLERANYASQAAAMQAYNSALAAGATQEQAKQVASAQGQIALWSVLGGYNNGGRGNGSRSGGNGEKEEKLSASDQKAMNEFGNLYRRAATTLSGDDIDAFIEAVAKDGMKYDDDTYSALNAMQYALNAKRELTAWNDSGQNYYPENALEYANAVLNSGHGYLLNGMEDVLQAAYKKKQ